MVAPTGGAIADKIGSVTLVIGICCDCGRLSWLCFAAGEPQYCHDRPGADAVVLCRDLCYAGHLLCTHGRMQRAEAFDGTAVGVISVIGFFPDVYMNAVAGTLMDAFPGAQGHKYLFIVMLAFAIVGTVASIVLSRMIKNTNKKRPLWTPKNN